ncbi:hypothetical protein PSPO01_07528 [Paraphaeosphaeria sporulosa]
MLWRIHSGSSTANTGCSLGPRLAPPEHLREAKLEFLAVAWNRATKFNGDSTRTPTSGQGVATAAQWRLPPSSVAATEGLPARPGALSSEEAAFKSWCRVLGFQRSVRYS